MSRSGITMSWVVLFIMALVSEYGSEWQATNAQLVALVVVLGLNIMVLSQIVRHVIHSARRRHIQ